MTTYNLTDVPFRVALHHVAGKKCVWCKEPVPYYEMQIDHLIPKSIDDATLEDQRRTFQLSADYDVNETYNLAPIHGRCNRDKSNHILPPTLISQAVLNAARERATAVEKKAESVRKSLSPEVTKIIAAIEMNREDPEVLSLLSEYILKISASVALQSDPTFQFDLLPDLTISIDSAGSLKAFSLGDCPNPNCITGDVRWDAFPLSEPPLLAGACDACGVYAVQCPDCQTKTSFVWDHEQPCEGCENRFSLQTVGGEIWEVYVLR